jgi:hypothetical protein
MEEDICQNQTPIKFSVYLENFIFRSTFKSVWNSPQSTLLLKKLKKCFFKHTYNSFKYFISIKLGFPLIFFFLKFDKNQVTRCK